MRPTQPNHQIPEPSLDDLNRIEALPQRIGGRDVSWGSKDLLDVWVIEQRALHDQRISERLRTASWALVVVTVALVACTAGLVWATLAAAAI
jgi:hypothetical protein